MSYVVTARKWRPQSFEEVVGQGHVCQTLQNAIRSQRVAHAYLFTGTRGVGKTTTARILAKALNCQEGSTPHPCNRCPSCRDIAIGSSLDVLEIDGASNRGIDEIRELRENARYAPAKGRYRIYIIDEVHMLTKEAFNALLKILEEPPAHVIFLLATTEADKLPVTILSRCQRFDLRMIPLTEIAVRLEDIVRQEGLAIDAESLRLIARKAQGSMRDAQSLLDQVFSFMGTGTIRQEELAFLLGIVDQEWLFSLMEGVTDRSPDRVLELIHGSSADQHDIREICRELLEYVRHLTVIKVTRNPERLIDLPPAEIERMKAQAQKVSLEELNMLFHILFKGEGEMRYSSQPHLVLEMALVKMALVKPVMPLEEILRRVEEMESRVAGDGLPQEPRNSYGHGPHPVTQDVHPVEVLKIGKAERPEDKDTGKKEEEEGKEEKEEKEEENRGRHTWQNILARLERNEQHPTLSSLLAHSNVRELDDEKLVVEVEGWCLSLVQGPDKLRAIEEAVQAVIGRALKTKLLPKETANEGSAAAVREKGTPTQGGRMNTQVLEGVLRDAWEIFGGTLISQGSWPKAMVHPEPVSEENSIMNGGKEDEAS